MNISPPPDRTTFSGLSSFHTVLWHITMKAIRKKQYSSRASNTPPPGQPKLSLSFCKTPSGRSSTEPSTGHFVMNISPPPDRTTFSGLSSFHTVLWHITMKAIRKKQYSSRASNTPPPGQPKLSLSFCKTPSGRSSTEPSTGHFVMNISPPPDRTTFSGLSSFHTVLWHITLKAIRKNNIPHVPQTRHLPANPKYSFSKSPCPVNPHPYRTKLISLPVCPAIQAFPRANSYCCRFCPAI